MKAVLLAAYIATVLLLLSSTTALPRVRTYRGRSRYEAMYTEPEPVPQLPNPRHHPDFYSHKYTEEYQRQGFGPVRPAWADALIYRWQSVMDVLRFDVLSTWKMLSPYFASKSGVADDIARFTFNSEGDKDFSAIRPDGSRTILNDEEHQNATTMSLPADSGFDYKNDKVRGVNIGNWLLFELWMDSQLSAALNNHAINAPYPNPIVDEWTAGLYSDYNWADHVLRKHFDTWITEQDFIDIKNAGLNHVRIPFPYWAFAEARGDDSPYLVLNRFDKLIEACSWARTHGLKVWVDIHGVPGSQNGYDNSGRSGPIEWATNRDYYTRTQYTFNRLATLFSQPEWQGTVTAVEAVNEPAANRDGGINNLIREYYPWARDAAARPPNSTALTKLLMAFHDGFLGPTSWGGFFTGKKANRVLLDTHPYFVYSDYEKGASDSDRLREVCALEGEFQQSQGNYPTIAGEMSVSAPNGDNSQYRDLADPPVSFPDGPSYPYSTSYMQFMAWNFAVQTATFEKASGWIFWAWRNRNALDWSYQAGLQYGWIPSISGSNTPYQAFGDDPCQNYR